MTDQNLQLFKGEDQQIDFTITDAQGNKIDFTQTNVVDAHIDVATNLNEYGEIKIDKVASSTDSNGSAIFNIEPSETENLAPGNYLYEVWVEFKNQDNYTAEVGKFFVKPRVDR